MEVPEEEKVEVKPTWKLAWGLWWKMALITLGISVIINMIAWFTVLKDMLAPLLAILGGFGG